MNMLAMQNIGQAFSENPVEALTILKDGSSHDSEGHKIKRRNSNSSSKNNNSFVSNAVRKNNQLIPSTYHHEGDS